MRRCLRGRHLLFSGDSISRYLYLSLATFLVSGVWPADGPLLAGEPSVCHERSFYHGESRSLQPWHEFSHDPLSHPPGPSIIQHGDVPSAEKSPSPSS